MVYENDLDTIVGNACSLSTETYTGLGIYYLCCRSWEGSNSRASVISIGWQTVNECLRGLAWCFGIRISSLLIYCSYLRGMPIEFQGTNSSCSVPCFASAMLTLPL